MEGISMARVLEQRALWRRKRKEALEQAKNTGKPLADFGFGYQYVRNRDRGWASPVPACPVLPGAACDRRFRDFYPISELVPAPPQSIDSIVDRVFESTLPEHTCLLATDWRFEEIVKDAARSVGYEFEGRKHENIAQILLKALHDLERSVLRFHANLSFDAASKFWTSWNLQRHMAEFADRVARSAAVRPLSRDPHQDARAAREQMNVQLAVYAHETSSSQPASLAQGACVPTRKELLERYRSSFPEKIKVLDICWAAAQHYSELKRWLRTDSPLKDGSTPDLAFRAILSSGKKPQEYRRQVRDTGWK
jgi:hypothetical protein